MNQVFTPPFHQSLKSKRQRAIQPKKTNKDRGLYLIIVVLEGVFNVRTRASSFHPVRWSFMSLIMGRRCLLLSDFTPEILLLSFEVVTLLSRLGSLCARTLRRRRRTKVIRNITRLLVVFARKIRSLCRRRWQSHVRRIVRHTRPRRLAPSRRYHRRRRRRRRRSPSCAVPFKRSAKISTSRAVTHVAPEDGAVRLIRVHPLFDYKYHR